MENEILITKKELEHLRGALLSHYDRYDKEVNGNMELNTHKKNYIFLAKKLTDLIQDSTKYGNTYIYKSIGTSQLLAFIHDTNQGDPKSFLIEACYPYVYGEKRAAFFQGEQGKALYNTWEDPAQEGVINEETKEREETKNLEVKVVSAPKQVIELTQDYELADTQPFWLRHIKLIALTTLLLFGANTYLTYKYYDKFQLQKLWTMPPSGEEINLKKRVTFVNDPAFQNIVLDCIASIEKQYQNLGKGKTKLPVSSELIYYKDTKNSEELSLMGYHFYTGFATWWSSDSVSQGLQDTVHTLFDNLIDSSFINAKNQNLYNPKAPFYIKEFLSVNQSEFLPVSILGVFVTPSTEILIRYPPFKEDKEDLKNYVLQNRQWFKDVYGTDKYTLERNTQIHWSMQSRSGQTINIGLSQPFLSMRKGTPLHRILWFKIPTNGQGSLLFCVNMILNN
ncbi:MAG: hypothetical protein U5L45_12410 [Saprospiraceae bacterium]|nr:hypothetical protein [Saprospiraceae bacterium]